MSSEKVIKYDVDGSDTITEALRQLLNSYPGLENGDEIKFNVLSKDSGKAMFPVTGAVIKNDKTDITGYVVQECQYPFYIIYRAAGLSEDRKAAVKEWLDNLGRWLEKQKITINGETHQLIEYPTLKDSRRFTSVYRQSPAYLDGENDNKSENWAISIIAEYINEYQK